MTIQPEASQMLQRSSYDLKTYRENNVDQSLPRQYFRVSREEGSEELKREILGCYKQPSNKLKAAMVVRFEGEGGTGSGPIREFLLCAMNILDEGIGMKAKPLVFLEGEDDHIYPYRRPIYPFDARARIKPSGVLLAILYFTEVPFCMAFPQR